MAHIYVSEQINSQFGIKVFRLFDARPLSEPAVLWIWLLEYINITQENKCENMFTNDPVTKWICLYSWLPQIIIVIATKFDEVLIIYVQTHLFFIWIVQKYKSFFLTKAIFTAIWPNKNMALW